MSEQTAVPEGWTHHERPPNLFRRFEFDGYGDTRTFLERLAEVSKQTGLYPDISFGKAYVNVTIHAQDGKAVGAEETAFAARANEAALPTKG